MTRAVSIKKPMTKLNCVEVWEPFDKRLEFVKKALNGDYEKNIFFTIHEWGTEHHFKSVNINLDELNSQLREKNKFIDIVESGYDLSTPRIYSNIRKHKFPIWFLVEAVISRWKTLYKNDQSVSPLTMDKNILDKEDFIYDFCSLSNKPHPHRCLLMDILAKHDLINKGAVSWRPNFPDYDPAYNFEYFDNQTRLLSDSTDPTTFPNFNEVAPEVENSFIQLISESTYRSVFITEKTALRMVNYKPFIVAGAHGFYKVMDKLGFVRYDELFDYSFDDVVDEVQRTEMVVENVLRFSNLTYDKKLQAIQSIRPKLIHNFNRTIRYAFDMDKWHPLVIDPINDYLNTGKSSCDFIVHTYLEIKRLKDFYNV